MDIFSPSKFEDIRQSEDEMVTEYKIITATSLRRQEGMGIWSANMEGYARLNCTIQYMYGTIQYSTIQHSLQERDM